MLEEIVCFGCEKTIMTSGPARPPGARQLLRPRALRRPGRFPRRLGRAVRGAGDEGADRDLRPPRRGEGSDRRTLRADAAFLRLDCVCSLADPTGNNFCHGISDG